MVRAAGSRPRDGPATALACQRHVREPSAERAGDRLRREAESAAAGQRFRRLGDDAHHAGVGVGAVHRRGGPIDDLHAVDAAQRILPGQQDHVRRRLVLLDVVEEQEVAIVEVGAEPALVVVRIDLAAAARHVEPGQVVEQLLEVEIAAPRDLVGGHHHHRGGSLAQALRRLRDRGDLHRRLRAADLLDQALEPRWRAGLERRLGAQQGDDRRAGLLGAVESEQRLGAEGVRRHQVPSLDPPLGARLEVGEDVLEQAELVARRALLHGRGAGSLLFAENRASRDRQHESQQCRDADPHHLRGLPPLTPRPGRAAARNRQDLSA